MYGPRAVERAREVLHTLGLGEDPPSSVEIQQRVKGRCL